MKKNIYLGLFALTSIAIGLFFLVDVKRIMPDNATKKVEEEVIVEEKPIGGERDEYGCLGPAGYSYSEQVMGCIRNWELDDNQKAVAALAIQKAGQTVGMTVIKVENNLDGTYAVTIQLPNTEQLLVEITYPLEIVEIDGTEDISEKIAKALAEKNEWETEGLIVSVNENEDGFASGTVNFEESETGGGGWFATLVEDVWKIIWDGNGVIFCEGLTDFETDFNITIPASLISECYDETLEDVVIR